MHAEDVKRTDTAEIFKPQKQGGESDGGGESAQATVGAVKFVALVASEKVV